MKHLTDYTNTATSKALKDHGAFFAFSTEQFDEQKLHGTKYTQMHHGMICPTANVTALNTALTDIHTSAIAQDLAENGTTAIIHRELANYEVGYTGDITDTVQALAAYGITAEQINTYYQANQDKFYD